MKPQVRKCEQSCAGSLNGATKTTANIDDVVAAEMANFDDGLTALLDSAVVTV